MLSLNPSVIDLLETLTLDIDKINWSYLSRNSAAYNLLEKNLDKINCEILSANPAAYNLLETLALDIDWFWLSENPNIFEINNKQLKENTTKKYKSIYTIY